MKKRFLSIAAAAVMSITLLTGVMPASASEVASGKCGENLTWTLSSEGVLTVSGTGDMYTDYVSGAGSVYVEFETNPWTYLDYSENIKEVIIKEGVTSIGYGAFYKLPNLETVVLPSTITEFSGGNKYGDGDTRYDKISYSFAECTSLKNLTLTEGMTCIGGHAFAGCTSLESVTIPATIEKWGQYSFYKCTSLKNITLKEGLTIMGSSAFRATAVESVVIPSTIESWAAEIHPDRAIVELTGRQTGFAFRDCQNLSSVTFADGLKSIKFGAFYNCTSLKSVVIPASVTDLSYAFACCTGLETAEIEKGSEMTALSNYAFYYCENLKELEIPAGVEISYSNARWAEGCNALESVYIHDQNYATFDFYLPDSPTNYYCYTDSTTYTTLRTRIYVGHLKDITDAISEATDELNNAVNEAKEINAEKYTAESYAALKTALENSEGYDENSQILSIKSAASDIRSAIEKLKEKTEPSSNPSSEPSKEPSKNPSNPTKSPTAASPAKSTSATRSAQAVAKDKKAAVKAMKQAKLTSLKVKSKAKKKINVTWKKVKKAKGYEVQVSAKKNFKKVIFKKDLKKTKLNIKNKKIKSKKTYYVRVRAYASYNDTNNKTVKVYSSWNKKLRKVKVK